jgi:hypothetical protein
LKGAPSGPSELSKLYKDPLPLDRVSPDTPLRLSVAAALAFPDGSMTASGRREAARGRLMIGLHEGGRQGRKDEGGRP